MGLNFVIGKLEKGYLTCIRLDWALKFCVSVSECVIITFDISFSFKLQHTRVECGKRLNTFMVCTKQAGQVILLLSSSNSTHCPKQIDWFCSIHRRSLYHLSSTSCYIWFFLTPKVIYINVHTEWFGPIPFLFYYPTLALSHMGQRLKCTPMKWDFPSKTKNSRYSST